MVSSELATIYLLDNNRFKMEKQLPAPKVDDCNWAKVFKVLSMQIGSEQLVGRSERYVPLGCALLGARLFSSFFIYHFFFFFSIVPILRY